LAAAGSAAAADRPAPPRFEFAFEAVVDVGPMMDLGEGPLGRRRMVPILGGSFEGPRVRGKVLPGGADRQLIRRDGVRSLTATYELQTDDGAVLGLVNRVTVDDQPPRARYAYSVVEITAPDGPHAWLNRSVFVGTLTTLRPEREAVRITVYQVI
jgi:hypothetical protein